MIPRRFTTSLLLATVLAAAGVVTTSAGKVTNYNVTTTVADTANGYLLRIESDTQGAYVTTKKVSSLIQRWGAGNATTSDWQLTTSGSGGGPGLIRTVLFDLTEPASSSNPVPPILAPTQLQAHLIAKCAVDNLDLLKIPTGGTMLCPGSFRFEAPNGRSYRFSFQPANFPEVNRMKFTCLGSDSIGCKLWTLTPSGTTDTGADPNPKNLNKLVEIDPGTDQVIADLGNYYISFNITIAR